MRFWTTWKQQVSFTGDRIQARCLYLLVGVTALVSRYLGWSTWVRRVCLISSLYCLQRGASLVWRSSLRGVDSGLLKLRLEKDLKLPAEHTELYGP